MKTNTEYRKRKHRITQERRWTDWRNWTEEIEKVFSQSLQTDMNKHSTHNWGEGLRKWNQVAWWRQWFGRPVPTAVSVVHLVGAARYLKLRTHSPHRILLELRSHRPRPITRGKSSGDFRTFTNSVTRRSTIPLGCSRPWRLTVWKKHSLQR